MTRFCHFLLLSLGLLSTSALAVHNQIILTLAASTANSAGVHTVEFTRAQLASLPTVSVTTTNPWTQGQHVYLGFSAEALLNLAKMTGQTLKITALNDYATEIPLTDFIDYGAIFATHMDGQPMGVRHRGPIMVIYPFDTYPEIRNETFYGRSIWQIRTLQIID